MGMAESPKDISGLGLCELKVLLVQALEENARLKAENAELREEIARLKGTPQTQAQRHGEGGGSIRYQRQPPERPARRQADEAQHKRNTDWQAGLFLLALRNQFKIK